MTRQCIVTKNSQSDLPFSFELLQKNDNRRDFIIKNNIVNSSKRIQNQKGRIGRNTIIKQLKERKMKKN